MKRVELQVANKPWGHEVCLASGEFLTLSLESVAEGEAETVFAEGSVTVFAWRGCRLRFEVNPEC